MSVHVDFCGEIHRVADDRPVVIGRDGQLTIDDNPYLHRYFLEVAVTDSIVWLRNVGSRLAATVADHDGLMNAWLAPGASLPIVFPHVIVWFTAGPTTYEFDIVQDAPPYVPTTVEPAGTGDTTIGRVAFTLDQRLLMLSLAEDVLRRGNRGSGTIPSSADAAQRLGWTITKFNRKLDNVCQKLAKSGVRGLHGDAEKLAMSRRARLVEYVVSARLISATDLPILDVSTSTA